MTGVGPTCVGSDIRPVWDLSETTLAHVGFHYGIQKGFANDFGMVPHLFRYVTHMGPICDNIDPMLAAIMGPRLFHLGLDMTLTWGISVTTWTPCGLTLWGEMGFVNYIGMGPT